MSKSLLEPKANTTTGNAITPERAEHYKQKHIDWLKSFNRGFNPENEDSWTAEHLPLSFKGAMYGSYCVPHERFAWEPGVINPFIQLWETEELLVSFDMFNITRATTPERPQVVAMATLRLILMDGSFKVYDQFLHQTRVMDNHEDAPPPENYRDLFIFKEEGVKWSKDRGCRLIKPNLEPGDLVLWDSRTMHYAKHSEGSQIRHAQCVCFTPARFADQQSLKEKAEIFRSWGGTTHWPHTNIHPQGKAKRDGQIDPQEQEEPLEKPIITDGLLQLAAVKAY